MTKLKLNVLAEKFIGTANGVYTAFIEAVDALKKETDIDLTVDAITNDADVIHYHTIGVEFILNSFKNKSKMVVSAHVVPDSFIGSLIFSKLWQPLAKVYLKFVYNRASLVVAVSPQVKLELEKIGVKSEIIVLCNSVDREKFKPDTTLRKKFRDKLSLSDNDFVVSCAGQIQPRKGVIDFVEVAKNLPNIKFVWMGGRPYGHLTEDYAAMTKAVDDAPKNIIWTGMVPFEDMMGYYAASDVYFMPSYQENFAFATIEASSVCLPLVLRNNIEYPSSLFTHYLKGKNADEFTTIIKTLADDKTEFKKWQKESDILASKYDIKSYMKQLIAAYKKLAKK